MSNYNGIISAPINIQTDVYAVLGLGSTTSGYDIGYACANTHGKINMWSKHKPIKWNKLAELTAADYQEANYGIIEPAGSREPDTAVEQGYVYQVPEGGKLSPYRITDFLDYYHNATYPCPKQENVTVNTFYGTEATFVPNINVTYDSRSISVADFSWLKDCYPALIFHITNGSTTTLYYRTAENKIGDNSSGEWNVLYSFNEPPFNDSRSVINNVYWLAATLPHPKGTEQPYLQTFYPLPYQKPEYAKFSVVITRTSPLIFSAFGLCQTPHQEVDDLITDYETGNDRWYDLTNNATLYYTFDVRNDSPNSVLITTGNLYISANKSFASGHVGQPTGQMLAEIYDYTNEWVSVSSITIGAGAKLPLRIGLKNFLSYYNGTEYRPGTGSLTELYTTLTYNGTILATTPPIDCRVL